MNSARSTRMAPSQAHRRPTRGALPHLCVGVGLAATVLVAATVLQTVPAAAGSSLTSYYRVGKKRRAGARRSPPRSTHACAPTQTSTRHVCGTVLRPLFPHPRPPPTPPSPRSRGCFRCKRPPRDPRSGRGYASVQAGALSRNARGAASLRRGVPGRNCSRRGHVPRQRRTR